MKVIYKSASLRLTALIVPLLMTSGCIVTDMKDTTDHMDATTSQMNSTTSQMNDRTAQMNDTTSSMAKDMSRMLETMEAMKNDTLEKLSETELGIKDTYSDLRQDEAVKVRHDMLEMMEQTSALNAKVVAAGKYIMSFEFQLWKNNLNDTSEYRDQLLRDAMEEFFLDLARYMPDPSDAPDPTSSKAQMQNLMAIAGTIDRVNPNAQVMSRKDKTVQQYSIQGLIEEALQYSDQVESGEISLEDLKPWQQEVLINRDAAISLLQARANFLPVMTLARISDLQHRNLAMQAWMTYHGFTPSFDNLAAMSEALTFIKSANDEIIFLKKIHVAPRIDGTLQSLYKNMNLPEAGTTIQSQHMKADKRVVRTKLEASLIKQLKTFRDYANGAAQ
jgi:hypothetical protein